MSARKAEKSLEEIVVSKVSMTGPYRELVGFEARLKDLGRSG